MKTLAEIELDYVRNTIEFFCREYPIHTKFDKYSGYKQSELKELISKQIKNRLVNSNLLPQKNLSSPNIQPVAPVVTNSNVAFYVLY